MHAKKTVNELTFEHDLNPNLVKNWVAKATFEIARVHSVRGRAGGSVSLIARLASATIFNAVCLYITESTSIPRKDLIDPGWWVSVVRQLQQL